MNSACVKLNKEQASRLRAYVTDDEKEQLDFCREYNLVVYYPVERLMLLSDYSLNALFNNQGE